MGPAGRGRGLGTARKRSGRWVGKAAVRSKDAGGARTREEGARTREEGARTREAEQGREGEAHTYPGGAPGDPFRSSSSSLMSDILGCLCPSPSRVFHVAAATHWRNGGLTCRRRRRCCSSPSVPFALALTLCPVRSLARSIHAPNPRASPPSRLFLHAAQSPSVRFPARFLLWIPRFPLVPLRRAAQRAFALVGSAF